MDKPLRATNLCRHYNYDRESGPSCARGIEIENNLTGNVFACLSHFSLAASARLIAACPQREDFAEAERDAWKAYLRVRIDQIRSVLEMVPGTSNDRRNQEHWGCGGTFACPLCGGTVSWSRSSYNGHARVRCSTAGCVEVIE